MTLLKILRDMNAGVTVHSFRSSFRDWVADQTSYPGEIAEAALAHAIPNKVEAAYRRTDFLAKRRDLMREWASYCLGLDQLDAQSSGADVSTHRSDAADAENMSSSIQL